MKKKASLFICHDAKGKVVFEVNDKGVFAKGKDGKVIHATTPKKLLASFKVCCDFLLKLAEQQKALEKGRKKV